MININNDLHLNVIDKITDEPGCQIFADVLSTDWSYVRVQKTEKVAMFTQPHIKLNHK